MLHKGLFTLVVPMAFFAGCLGSNSPDREQTTDVPTVRSDFPLLRDPDNQAIEAVPVDILQDIRRQMLEKGLKEDLAQLEAAYDFKTGKLRPSPPAKNP